MKTHHSYLYGVMIKYNPNNTITDHIVALVQQYQSEYQQNINKTSLNTSGF